MTLTKELFDDYINCTDVTTFVRPSVKTDEGREGRSSGGIAFVIKKWLKAKCRFLSDRIGVLELLEYGVTIIFLITKVFLGSLFKKTLPISFAFCPS